MVDYSEDEIGNKLVTEQSDKNKRPGRSNFVQWMDLSYSWVEVTTDNQKFQQSVWEALQTYRHGPLKSNVVIYDTSESRANCGTVISTWKNESQL